ncbi:hypothetical protein G6O69_17350 [Pseudenhygromyxa sp. WMMC2535]|uniref:hypothetical protein n=1 Tax=Pseudenhygromyxa sp. WMMC2535 TaxID=2712867 RepID=UPI0015957812|nr:hypothetical protein [Pseudenhygromyxa sp. WMMC2535]NVB39612.1 hypothetical protein [Pseudenhygromyxa sp. WMMC2535]
MLGTPLGVELPEPQAGYFEQVLASYREGMGEQLPWMLVALLGTVFLGTLWNALVARRPKIWAGERWLRLAMVLAVVAYAVDGAIEVASCFDDAYISLRYADNLAHGRGLVWNAGERVEGYSNFLWTVMIAGLIRVTDLQAPVIAVVMALVAYASNLLVIWRISLKIAPPRDPRGLSLPITVLLLAIQPTFVDYATSGLETGFASLLVNLGVLALIRAPGPVAGGERQPSKDWVQWSLAGLCWILATLTRPDHAIFYAVGSAVVFAIWVVPAWRGRSEGLAGIWRQGLRPMVGYALPFCLWLLHAAWKLSYYGELLPNTYYAKSAYLSYYAQGLIYALSFHLSSQIWLVLLAVPALWLVRRPSNTPGRRFAALAIPAVLGYEFYVLKIGGDFMFGRFYMSLLPLILLSGEQLVHELTRSRTRLPEGTRAPLGLAGLAIAGLLAATSVTVPMHEDREVRWFIANEANFYRITTWEPLRVRGVNYRDGRYLGRMRQALARHDPALPEPIIATSAIGLIGYHSGLPLIDRLGLTDSFVANQETGRRGRPGHDKWASRSYLDARGVHFQRGNAHPGWLQPHAQIRFGHRGFHWSILRYDRALMQGIRESYPKARFTDAEDVIDQFLRELPEHGRSYVMVQSQVLDDWYFEHSEDPVREQLFERYLVLERRMGRSRLTSSGRWRQELREAGIDPDPPQL